MKAGDRIKVVRTDEYSEHVRRVLGGQSPVGMTGTVIKVRYNGSMGRNEVYARIDGRDDDNSCHLFDERDLEVIN